jgi:hypothetical protein
VTTATPNTSVAHRAGATTATRPKEKNCCCSTNLGATNVYRYTQRSGGGTHRRPTLVPTNRRTTEGGHQVQHQPGSPKQLPEHNRGDNVDAEQSMRGGSARAPRSRWRTIARRA